MKLTLSLGQMHIHLGEPEKNFARVREWTAEAARRGSALVVFPELWSTAYDLENWPKHAAPLGEGMFAHLSALAKERRIAIASSVLEALDGKAYNTFAFYGPDGGLWAAYRKVHLVPMLDEHLWLAAGGQAAGSQGRGAAGGAGDHGGCGNHRGPPGLAGIGF